MTIRYMKALAKAEGVDIEDLGEHWFEHIWRKLNFSTLASMINASYGAENLARTKGKLSTVNTVIQMWIDSEVHRMNMLNNYGDSIGLAYTKNGNKVYWVQIYGQEK